MPRPAQATIADQVEHIPHALTVRDLKAILQVSDQTIYRMVADQTVPYFLVRRSYRFDPKQIAEWLRKRSVAARLSVGLYELEAGFAERAVYFLQYSLAVCVFQIPHCAREILVAHPLLDRAEVYARLQMRGCETRPVFVEEPVVAERCGAAKSTTLQSE